MSAEAVAQARQRARQSAQEVEGWLSEEQGEALFTAAAAAEGKGAIVEIGSWKGRSTIWLARGARLAGRKVVAVDPHANSREIPAARTFAEFQQNIIQAGVEDAVTALVMTSAEAARAIDGGVEVLFIDGDHAQAGVLKDVQTWFPRLVDGAVVLFHDVATTDFTGPRRVFQQSVCWSSQFDSIRRVGSMTVARRVARRDVRSAMWGWTAGTLLYLFDAKRALRRLGGR